ncbi:MAG: alpha/beta hydrolase [Rubrivivax sp.]|nr:alpha/beta hydrolase [Rubrivivax sp.]
MLAFDRYAAAPPGDRPCVVLLHGVGGGRRIWDAAHGGFAATLAAAGCSVLAFDLPGYGDSALPAELSMPGMAQAVLDTLRVLRTGPVVLLGHSMGGMVAQEILVQDPPAACGLILTCTSPAFGSTAGDWQAAFLRDRLAPLDAGQGMPALARRLVSAMVAPGASPLAVEQGVEVMGRVPEATYRAALRALIGFDRRAALPQIAVPCLCLAAEQDRTAAPDVMQRMAQRIPGSAVQVLPGAGHLAHLEQPAAFAEAVIRFLQQHLWRST